MPHDNGELTVFANMAQRQQEEAPTAPHDEEALAIKVESRVRGRSGVVPGPLGPQENPQSAPGTCAVPAAEWGGLPAPWEPMPEWVAGYAPQQVQLTRAEAPAAPAAASASSGNGNPVAVMRGEQGRFIDDPPAPDPQSSHDADSRKRPSPDLDSLARQVYAVMKRRLAAERRRELFS
jgi:hypothetical protein